MKVLFFGIAKDIVGQRELDNIKGDLSTVEDLLSQLKNTYPRLKDINSLAVGVNQQYAQPDTKLNENDVVAVIPPVSGG